MSKRLKNAIAEVVMASLEVQRLGEVIRPGETVAKVAFSIDISVFKELEIAIKEYHEAAMAIFAGEDE